MSEAALIDKLKKLHIALGEVIEVVSELLAGNEIEVPAPPTAMVTSADGVALIKEYEGLRLRAYHDSGGVATIGYGHTNGVKMGQSITEEQAEAFLKNDLVIFERSVSDLVKVPVSQHQFDALVSFTYNLGGGALQKSTLLRLLNQGDYAGAADQFERWKYDGGKVLQGLVRRRAAEKELFLS